MSGGGKGGSSSSAPTTSNSSVNTTTPPDYLNSAYQNLASNAQNTAYQPFQNYSGQRVADLNATQNKAFGQIDGSQGVANPYLDAARNATSSSQTPLWSNTQQYSPNSIQNYYNPYLSNVVNSTMANINETNAQQQAQLQGNAASKNALGGDRAGVASAELARQQGLAAGQTLSQLQNQGFAQAQNEFNTQQQQQLGANEAQNWMNSQAANTYGNLGNIAHQTTAQDNQALLASGNQQQQQTQQGLNVGYQDWMQRQAYPFQSQSWLANILTGLGGVAGGTTAGNATTTGAATGNNLSSLIGAGTAAYGTFNNIGNNNASNAGSSYLAGQGYSSNPSGDVSVLNNGDTINWRNRGGRTYHSGGLVPRRLASGGSSDTPPDTVLYVIPDGSYVPTPTPLNTRANFPDLMKAPELPKSSGSSSDPMGGIDSMLGGGSGGGGMGNMMGMGKSMMSMFGGSGGSSDSALMSSGDSMMSSGDAMSSSGDAMMSSGDSMMSSGDSMMSGWRRGGIIQPKHGYKSGGLVPRRFADGGTSDITRDTSVSTDTGSSGPYSQGSNASTFIFGSGNGSSQSKIDHSNKWMSQVGDWVGTIIGGLFGGPAGAFVGGKAGADGGGTLGDLFGGNWDSLGSDIKAGPVGEDPMFASIVGTNDPSKGEGNSPQLGGNFSGTTLLSAYGDGSAGLGTSGGGQAGNAAAGTAANMIGSMLSSGGLVPRKRLAGGGSPFGTMSADRHLAPRVNIGKVPNLLSVPKFDDGGTVGGMVPSAQNQNPMIQNRYKLFSQMPIEKLQEMAARIPQDNPQSNLVRSALSQKQMMANKFIPTSDNTSGGGLSVPPAAINSDTPGWGGYSKGGAAFADGGSDDEMDQSQGDDTDYPLPQENRSQPSYQDNQGNQPVQAGLAPRHPIYNEPDANNSIIRAGLSMMAGRSRNPWENVANGALAGMNDYDAQKKSAADQAYKEMSSEQAAKKLEQEAQSHQDAISNKAQQLDIEKTKAANLHEYQQGLLDRGKWSPYSVTTTGADGKPVVKSMPFNTITGEFGSPMDGTVSHPATRGNLSQSEINNRAVIAAQRELQSMASQGKSPPNETPEQYVNRRSREISEQISANPSTSSPAKSSTPTPLSAPPPAQDRITGQTYMTPRGAMKWMGEGWLPITGQ